MTPTEFLSRLSRVKKQAGDGSWLASCPAHGSGGGDKNPSLSIKAADGKILLNCFAGCGHDAILSAMGLEEKDLFEQDQVEPKKQLVAIYQYRDFDGAVLFEVCRYTPKTFRQRRPDGHGGWIYDLKGVRRVVYRLPELKQWKAILWVEGEKDADTAWSLEIPATTNAMGAGKWSPEYAQQLVTQGIERVAVIPDNDGPGAAHATTVTAGLQAAGIEVRLVVLPDLPDHGDLSDYLQTHSKDDLLTLVKAAKVAERVEAPARGEDAGPSRTFRVLGEQRYGLEIQPEGIVIEVDRLRRTSHELVGELIVRSTNGHFPEARTFGEGVLTAGDLNFSSVQARSTRAKLLAERAGDKTFDWYGSLEEFVTTVIATERKGKPAVTLAEIEPLEERSETWMVLGWPVLQDLPQLLFGDSEAGKSLFAMYVAGALANDGVRVLYADWEFSEFEHRKRLGKLFRPMPRNLKYVRCEHPLKHEVDHLQSEIRKHDIQYLIADSVSFAVEGSLQGDDGATAYFRYLRALKVGSLSIAHIPKHTEDGKEAQAFGSTFFRAGARSCWFIERAKENPAGELRVGLYHRKNNLGERAKPKGFKFVFRGDRVLLEPMDLETVDELAVNLPLIERIKKELAGGAVAIKALAEAVDAPVPTVRSTLSRHKSQFVRMGPKVGLKAPEAKDESVGF